MYVCMYLHVYTSGAYRARKELSSSPLCHLRPGLVFFLIITLSLRIDAQLFVFVTSPFVYRQVQVARDCCPVVVRAH